jgi:hypothetical protein
LNILLLVVVVAAQDSSVVAAALEGIDVRSWEKRLVVVG